MANRKKAVKKRQAVVQPDYRVLLGDELNNDDFFSPENEELDGCCAAQVLHTFAYDRDLGLKAEAPTKAQANNTLAEIGGKLQIATLDVEKQSIALATLKSLGFEELKHFKGQSGANLVLLAK